MCPLAVRYLLSSIYPSAMGTTRLEIESQLKLRKLDPMFVYKVLEEEFLGEAKNLQIANRVFVDDGVWLKPIYRKHMRHLQFEQVDFTRATLAAEIINEWSEEATDGYIHHVIDPDEIHEDLQMILLNAIHFKSPWRVPFLERRTRKQQFRMKSGQMVRTDIMIQHPADVRYTESQKLNAQIVEIPYASHFVMWIILPSPSSNLQELIDKLSPMDFLEINRNFTMKKISLELPKFFMDTKVDGKTALEKMGAPSIFTNPDFDIAMNHRSMVGDIKQRIKLEIDEEGSELEIVSWMGVLQRVGIEFPTFHAHRPFMFLILTSKSFVPIFLGHMAQPPGDMIQCNISHTTNHFEDYDGC